MRSRSCTTADPEHGCIQKHTKGFSKQQQVEEEKQAADMLKRRIKAQRQEKEGRTGTPQSAKKTVKPAESCQAKTPDSSKRDSVHSSGVMEGEVQAREDIIRSLKSDRTKPETSEAHYSSAIPSKPSQALQRDATFLHCNQSTNDVYERPMAESDRSEDKQKETYRRMSEQSSSAEKCHRRTVVESDNEKRKHADFINKSDDFTNSSEQERERSKRSSEQEKAHQARKDKEHGRRSEKVQAESGKLKSFTSMSVDERQLHVERIHQQNQKIQDLSQKSQDKETRSAASSAAAEEDGQKVSKSEAQVEVQEAKFRQEREDSTAKSAQQVAQNKQSRSKSDGMVQKTEESEERNGASQKCEEESQELREKMGKGERGNSSSTTESENSRKKVSEMEGKDEEITRAEGQCRESRGRSQEEENHNKESRSEVDKLQKRMVESEKSEGAFSRSKTECSQLHKNSEKERKVVKDSGCDMERSRAQLKESESSESKSEKAEMVLKDESMKSKSFTVISVDERKAVAERSRKEERENEGSSATSKAEQGKVTEVTEKSIEESKKLLKVKAEMEGQSEGSQMEKEESKSKLRSSEEECVESKEKSTGMKTRVEESERKPEEDNRVGESAAEVERLKGRSEQSQVVEGDSMKSEDEYDLSEKKFRQEQERANASSKSVEEMRGQVARDKAVERGEAKSSEAQSRIRCKVEEAKTRESRVQVSALKEKIHELMNKEDQLSQSQVDFAVLQQRFVEEEERRRSMSVELENSSRESEATRRYSRASRPSLNGRRMVDVPVTSTAVQTEATADGSAEDETTAGFIRKSVSEENHSMNNLRQHGPRRPAVSDRFPPAAAERGGRSCPTHWMNKTDAVTSTRTKEPPNSGQPLHIRVTPDHETSMATSEITSPRSEDFFSSTTIIPTLGFQKPRITIVPKPAAGASKTTGWDGGPDRAKSPVTITAISRTKSPEKPVSSPGVSQSPVSIITVSTTPVADVCAAFDPHENAARRTSIKMTSEKPPEPARKYSSNIITTEDNKIHIHSGSQFPRTSEGCSAPPPSLKPTGGSSDRQETPTGTVSRSPRHASAGKISKSKMTSSITINPVASAASRPVQSVPGSDVQSARLPVSRGVRSNGTAVSGVSAVTRSESRSEGQAMKIESEKSTASGSASAAAGGNT